MGNTKVYKAKAAINDGETPKEYIAIENENGVLLVNHGLFVISFETKDAIPFYERILLVEVT